MPGFSARITFFQISAPLPFEKIDCPPPGPTLDMLRIFLTIVDTGKFPPPAARTLTGPLGHQLRDSRTWKAHTGFPLFRSREYAQADLL